MYDILVFFLYPEIFSGRTARIPSLFIGKEESSVGLLVNEVSEDNDTDTSFSHVIVFMQIIAEHTNSANDITSEAESNILLIVAFFSSNGAFNIASNISIKNKLKKPPKI